MATYETSPPDRAKPQVVIFNNIVTPYTNRLYNRLSDELTLAVVSAAGNEANRNWGSVGEPAYAHTVLEGLKVQLGPGRFAYLNKHIFRTLWRLRPRLLVINGFYPSMVLAALYAVATGTRLGLTIDGWAETMPDSAYHRIIRPLLLKACRFVVTPGEKGADWFRAQGFAAERIHTVPLVPAWDGPARVPAYIERRFDIVWAAHLNNEVKNAGFLVELCRRLKPMRPLLSVRIVGDGPAREDTLAGLRALGVSVTHDASLPWSEMAEVFSSARLLVLPSLWEPWGLVCNEALQCGVPVIVSPHVGAGADLVRDGETGAVLPLDADTWAAEALSILASPERWQMLSANGRAEMAARSLDASALKLAGIFRAQLA